MNLKYCWSVWSVLVQAVRPSGYQLFINKYAQWPASLLWTLWRNFKFVTATFWFALVSLILIFRLNFLTTWHAVWSEFLRTWTMFADMFWGHLGLLPLPFRKSFYPEFPAGKARYLLIFLEDQVTNLDSFLGKNYWTITFMLRGLAFPPFPDY